MFMQIIQGQVRDMDAARETIERWRRDLEPNAIGWLGGTYGFTDDGTLLAAVRFESQDAAMRNSQRPEQGEWWQEMAQHFVSEPEFHSCDDVKLLLGGGSDDAGFVQVIQGRLSDPERARVLADESAGLITRYRPDILGAALAIDENGFCTETVWFTSEAAAREAEVKDMPPDAKRVVEEEMSLLSDVHFLDLHHPWFATHG